MVGSSREVRSSKTFPKDNVSVSIGPVPQTQILRVDRTRMCDPQPKILPFGWSQCSVGCRVATCLHVDHGPVGSRCMRKLFQNSPLDHPAPLQGGVVDRGGGSPRAPGNRTTAGHLAAPRLMPGSHAPMFGPPRSTGPSDP
jgi:hypothetical protein